VAMWAHQKPGRPLSIHRQAHLVAQGAFLACVYRGFCLWQRDAPLEGRARADSDMLPPEQETASGAGAPGRVLTGGMQRADGFTNHVHHLLAKPAAFFAVVGAVVPQQIKAHLGKLQRRFSHAQLTQ